MPKHADLLDALHMAAAAADVSRGGSRRGSAAEVDELGDRLARTAQALGTHGAGARRAVRHVADRRRRTVDLTRLAEHRRPDHGAGPLVDPEHIDPTSGAGVGPLLGWDCTDPWRPTWRSDPGDALASAA